MAKEFAAWLNEELAARAWDYATLARQSGLADATISNVVNCKREPGIEFCRSVAAAFGLRDVDVLRKAGLIDPVPGPAVVEEERATHLIRRMSPAGRQAAIEILESLLRADERDARKNEERRNTQHPRATSQPESQPPQSHTGTMAEVEARFRHRLAQLPPEADDSERRRLAQEVVSEIWDRGTDDQRALLVQLVDALASIQRRERQAAVG